MKTLGELKQEIELLLKEAPELESCPVYVYADHGQEFIQMNQMSVDYTMEYSYYADVWDLEELEPEELKEIKPFVTIGD
jgi:hypothetical protein